MVGFNKSISIDVLIGSCIQLVISNRTVKVGYNINMVILLVKMGRSEPKTILSAVVN